MASNRKPLFYVWKKNEKGEFTGFLRALRAVNGKKAIKEAAKKAKDNRLKSGEFVAFPSGIDGHGATITYLSL